MICLWAASMTRVGQAFVLIGKPDVGVRVDLDDDVLIIVRVDEYDAYDPKTGQTTGGGDAAAIICWTMDTDYDRRSFCAHSVLFRPRGDAQIGMLGSGLGAALIPACGMSCCPANRPPFQSPGERGLECA